MRLLRLLALAAGVALATWAVHTGTGDALDLTARSGPGQVALYLVGLAAIALFVRFVWRRSLREPFRLYGQRRHRILPGFGVCFGVTVGVTLAGYLLLGSLGVASWVDGAWQGLDLRVAEQTTLALLVAFVLATTEEIIFRGFVYGYLRRDGEVEAVLASALIFALAHNFRDPAAWLAPGGPSLLVGLTLLGALLALVYGTTRSLACAIGVHAGLLAVRVFLRKTHLLAVSQTPWWMGTADDIRTAPAVWIFFLILAALFWLLRRPLAGRYGIEATGR